MGKVDLLHQSEDQHEAKRNQGEKQAERYTVQQMRKEIERRHKRSSIPMSEHERPENVPDAQA
jgi:hypothetical protein